MVRSAIYIAADRGISERDIGESQIQYMSEPLSGFTWPPNKVHAASSRPASELLRLVARLNPRFEHVVTRIEIASNPIAPVNKVEGLTGYRRVTLQKEIVWHAYTHLANVSPN
jgi:hypothetical protein